MPIGTRQPASNMDRLTKAWRIDAIIEDMTKEEQLRETWVPADRLINKQRRSDRDQGRANRWLEQASPGPEKPEGVADSVLSSPETMPSREPGRANKLKITAIAGV